MDDNLLEGAIANSPLTNTYNSTDMNICIDWLTYMVPYTKKNLSYVLMALKLDYDSYDERTGKFDNMFTSLRTYGDVTVKLPSQENDDVWSDNYFCFELTGKACRSFEDRKGSWNGLFNLLRDLGKGHCTRIDTPIDDFSGKLIPFNEVYNKLVEHHYVATFSRCNVIGNMEEIKNGTHGSTTVYLGSRGSERSMCIYNKIGERLQAGVDVFAKYWIRYEMRFAHDKANRLFNLIADNGMEYFAEIVSSAILDFIEFKVPEIDGVPTLDSNVSRWDTWWPWREFLGTSSKLKLRVQNDIESSITEKKVWFDRSMAGMITAFYLTAVSYDQFIRNINYSMFKYLKEQRLDSKNFELVTNDRAKRGLGRLSFREFCKKLNEINNRLGNDNIKFDLVDIEKYRSKFYKNELSVISDKLKNEEEAYDYFTRMFGDIFKVEV